MVLNSDDENWVPLVEFSVKKGISLSTLRRYIKANKIPWKLIEGRYLVMDDGTIHAPRNHDPDQNIIVRRTPEISDIESRLKHLETELSAAHEEIAELKTLIAFYEENWSQNKK